MIKAQYFRVLKNQNMKKSNAHIVGIEIDLSLSNKLAHKSKIY